MRPSIRDVVDTHVEIARGPLGAIIELEILSGHDPVEHLGGAWFDDPSEDRFVELS